MVTSMAHPILIMNYLLKVAHKMGAIQTHLKNLSITTLLYVGSYQAVTHLINPLQMYFGTLTFASLVFLPHGIRVLSAILYGARNSFIYIIFASCVVFLIDGSSDRTAMPVIWQILASGSCAPFALVLLRFGFGDKQISLDNVTKSTWRSFFVLVIFSSLLNGIMQNMALNFGGIETNDISLLITFSVGDFIGAIVTFVIAQIFFKHVYPGGRQ